MKNVTQNTSLQQGIRRSLKGLVTFRGELVIILLAAAALRFTGLESRSYFNDELSVLYRLSESPSFSELLDEGVIPDYHPAGVQVFVWWWSGVAGESQFWLRLPFALAGIAGVWLMYLLASRWFGKTSGWLAAATMALLHFPVLYSQMLRPYSTGMLWVLAAALFWDRLIFCRNDESKSSMWTYAAGLALSFALAMYNHYYSFLVCGIMGITGLFMLKRHNVIPYLAAGAIAVALFLPHWPITAVHLSRGGLSTWLPPPDTHWIPQHLLYLFNGSFTLLLLVALPAVIMIGKRVTQGLGKRTKQQMAISWLWYFLPLAFGYFYSTLINPIIQHSVMLFAFPFLLAGLFAGFDKATSPIVKTYIVVIPLVLAAHLLFGVRHYQQLPYANFRHTADMICAQHGGEHTAWAADVNHPWYIHHYLDQACHIDSALFYLFPGHKALRELDQQLESLPKQQFLYSRLRPADPMAASMIRRHYPYLIDCYDQFPYTETYLFSRQPGISDIAHYPLDTVLLARKAFHNLVDSSLIDHEYLVLHDARLPKENPSGRNILIHCDVHTYPNETLPDDLHLVIHSLNHDGTTASWHGFRVNKTIHRIHPAFFTVALPHNTNPANPLKVYLWNPEKEPYRLRSAEVYWLRERESESKKKRR